MYAHTHRHRHPGRIGERETTAIPSSPQLRKLLVKKKNLTLQFNGPRGRQSSPLKGAIQVQAADMPLGLLWMRVGTGSRGSVGSGAPTLHTSSQDSSMLTCLMLLGCQIDLERGSSAIISFKETLWSGARARALWAALFPSPRGCYLQPRKQDNHEVSWWMPQRQFQREARGRQEEEPQGLCEVEEAPATSTNAL